MDGLGRCLGTAVEIVLHKRAYWLEPLTLGRLATIENHLLAQRDSPIDSVRPAVMALEGEPVVQAMLIEAATDEIRRDKAVRVIDILTTLGWLQTSEGVAYTAWLCLHRHGEPAFSELRTCEHFFRGLPENEQQEFVRRRDLISGLDLLSKLDWPPTDSDEESGPKWAPWKKSLRSFAEAGWTMTQVAELTLYQLKMFTSPEAALGGRTKMSWADAQKFIRTGKAPITGPDFPARREARRKLQEQARARRK